ncbi:MAG: outer membrane beta-barrel protein [Hyphomicrobiaceae bacterium]|nr:outer membrane beta-barrel protein [Hyphomicrobiaceae bacterium]
MVRLADIVRTVVAFTGLWLVAVSVGPGARAQDAPDPSVVEAGAAPFGGPAEASAGAAAGADAGSAPGATAAAAGSAGAGGRPVIRDGDLSYPAEPAVVVDGLLQPEDETVPQDGADLDSVDTRSEAEFAPFETPPAGYDPLLFQIEGVAPADPRLNRLPGRLFRQEPYDPIGIRIGSFVFFPEVEVAGNWTSNVLSTPDGPGDRSLELAPSGRLVSNWSNHAVELSASGDLSYHDDLPTEDDRGFAVEARSRLDVTRATNVEAVIGRQRAQESRSAIDAATAGPRAAFTRDSAGGRLQHRFNRLTVALRGAVADTVFQGSADPDRDVTEARGAVRAAWEFKPTLSGFGEVEVVRLDYRATASSDGIAREADGQRYRLGTSFGNTSQVLRGEIAIGWADQDLEDDRLVDVGGVILDANLAYRFSELTSFLLTAASDISGTTTAGTGGVLERRAGLEVRHAFRRHLVGSAAVGVATRDYAGIDIDEREVTFGLGAEYFLSPEAVVFTQYEHTRFRSDFPDSTYDIDTLRIGMRVRR